VIRFPLRPALGFLGLVALGLVAAAPDEAALPAETRAELERLVKLVPEESRAYETVRSLTDHVGPRLAGSPGDKAAVAWAVETLKAQGFVNVRAEPVKVPHWERGAEEWGRVVSPNPQVLHLCALGGSVATPAEGLEAEVIEAGSLEAVDALGEKAKGKIVLLYKKTERAKDGSGYGKTVPLRVFGAARAAKVGAVGVLLRSVGTSTNRLPHTGMMRYDDGGAKIPAAALSTVDADLLHRLLEEKKPVRVRFKLSCQTFPDADSANVVGEIRGREKPDEIVVMGGHLDSWDLGTGAVDDGAGCGTVMEAARLIGTLPRRPRRTLRVVLFANEENGARGAAAYEEAHRGELAKHVAALEADSGAGRSMGFSWNAGPSAEKALVEVATVLFGSSAAEMMRKGGDGGVDIAPLRAGGVPLFGIRQDASKYFDIHHSANDTLEKIDPDELDSGVLTTAGLAYALADLPVPVERLPPK